MADDLAYRWAIGALVLLFAPVGVYHRLRAATGERLNRLDEGLFVLVGIRLCGLAAMAITAVYLVNPHSEVCATVGLPTWMRWAGLPLGLAAVGWLAWTMHSLGRNLTDTVTVRQAATLVTSGPYRWVRHPFYLGVATFGLAAGLLADSEPVLVLLACVFGLQLVRTTVEEAQLEARFGDAYRAYKDRTGWIFPRLSRRARDRTGQATLSES